MLETEFIRLSLSELLALGALNALAWGFGFLLSSLLPSTYTVVSESLDRFFSWATEVSSDMIQWTGKEESWPPLHPMFAAQWLIRLVELPFKFATTLLLLIPILFLIFCTFFGAGALFLGLKSGITR